MPTITFEVDPDLYHKLEEVATLEERDPPRQAKMFVMQALQWKPPKPARETKSPTAKPTPVRSSEASV